MFRKGDKVRNKNYTGPHKGVEDIGEVDRTNLGAGMRDLVLVRFNNLQGVPSGDGYCIPITQLEKIN